MLQGYCTKHLQPKILLAAFTHQNGGFIGVVWHIMHLKSLLTVLGHSLKIQKCQWYYYMKALMSLTCPMSKIKLVPFLASKFKVAFVTIIVFVVQCNWLLAIVTWGAFSFSPRLSAILHKPCGMGSQHANPWVADESSITRASIVTNTQSSSYFLWAMVKM